MTKTKQRKKAYRQIHAQMHDSIIRLRSRIKALKRLYYKTGQEWYWVEREECKKDITKLYEEMIKFEAENADYLKPKHRPHIDKAQYEQQEHEKLEWSDDFKRTVQKIEESFEKIKMADMKKDIV